MKRSDIRALVATGLPPAMCRLHARLLDALVNGAFKQFYTQGGDRVQTPAELRFALLQYLMHWIRETLQANARLNERYDEFLQQHAHAATAGERDRQLLKFVAAMGADGAQLRSDRRALKRWFGLEAVSERLHRRSAESARDVAFVLQRIGALCGLDLQPVSDPQPALNRWRRIGLEPFLKPLLAYRDSPPVRIAAFHSLVEALRALPAGVRQQGVDDATLRYIYRAALDRRQEIGLQCEALKLLAELSPASLAAALEDRLGKAAAGDDLFVRRVAVQLLGEHLGALPRLETLLETVQVDPSPAVRQLLAPALQYAPRARLTAVMRQLVRHDAVPQVRAAALEALPNLYPRGDTRAALLTLLADCLAGERDEFVLRVALWVAAQGYHRLAERDEPELADQWCAELLPAIAKLHGTAASTAVRRYAAEAHEHIWVRSDPLAWQLAGELGALLAALGESRRARLPAGLRARMNDARFGRVLAWLVQRDFGLDVEAGRRASIRRGDRFGFRSWRLLHELRSPATDKRQAFRHTVGRVFRGTLRVPSGILAELASTKVPGEPLFVASEGGWRPYLPLVDELISALDQPWRAGPLRLYTSEGVTEVYPPRALHRRLAARLRLTLQFEDYARLRNWREQGSQRPGRYLERVQELGFEVRFRAHGSLPDSGWGADPAVTRFFPAVLPFSAGEWLQRLEDYFFSVYENSLAELILFLLGVAGWFVGRHLWLSHLIRRARRSMPLVIGGWGTRGKSGTERLKAALFNALGYNVVSKTTGCEAMFLHAHAHGALREMFLFRPYDKATIWEQVQVLRLARSLNAEVFLWECMGLTPAYVEILQQHWMKDDLSTITNTYPDHEDLQGPAGINIPRVMTNFIPARSSLLTSEEQMLPILRQAALARGTRVRAVGWREAGLLAPDLLARFPYQEHPYNIALVMAMAEELGIEADFAIRAMADRVVADLGVLKVSPPAPVRGRSLEFTNGMSANERFGCLANWERMGFASHDPYAEPAVALTTVVNNRADRVSRSRVFASMLVNDLMADRHVLIGSNLNGLRNYVAEAWEGFAETATLWPAEGGQTPLQVLEAAARRLRVRYTMEQVQQELAQLLANLGIANDAAQLQGILKRPARLSEDFAQQIGDVEVLQSHLEQRLATLDEYQTIAERSARAGRQADAALDDAFRAQLRVWFERKLVVVEDYHANGEQIIEQILRVTPPGGYNRIMGVQNIKGTGLDFVYRWQAWETCHGACVELLSEDEATAQRGLRALAGFRDFGRLSAEYVTETLETARHSRHAQTERFQAELKVVASNLDLAMQRVQAHLASQRSGGWLAVLANAIEAFLDAGDAVSRRKRANVIYRDLATQRISHEQAALELQALNKRQKGGWLLARLERLWARLRAQQRNTR